MLPGLAIFILKTTACTCMFMLYYLVALKGNRMHGFNRWYLLATALIGTVVPFVHFNLFQFSSTEAAAFPILEIMGSSSSEDQTAPIVESESKGPAVFMFIYVSVAAAMLFTLLIRVIRIYLIRRRYGAERIGNYWVIKVPFRNAPFSFLNMLFWKDSLDLHSEEARCIMAHELTHIRQHHTIDKLLIQVLLASCWLNPCLWLLRRELWLQHEFSADSAAIANGDADSFARMLLKANFPAIPIGPVNSFYYSPIKRRLMMLTQPNGIKNASLRRILVVPLFFITFLMFSFTVDNNEQSVVRSSQLITVVLDAAHGGKDLGGIGKGGQREKDLTLRICDKLTSLSAAYNIRIQPIRERDAYFTPQDRVHKGNSVDADLFLSIHVNKSTPDDPRGNNYELAVSPASLHYRKSLTLASAMVPRLKAVGIVSNIVEPGSIHVLKASKHPALLLECGNIDDPENLTRLMTDESLEALCRSILSAIVDYQASLRKRNN